MRLPDAQRSRCALIGVSRYTAGNLIDLPPVAENLSGLTSLLVDPHRCGIDARHIATVLDPPGPHQAGSAVLTAAEEAEDLLLVYVAGRVALGSTGEPQVMLSAAGARRHAASLPVRLIRAAVEDSPAAHKVVIFDVLLHGDEAVDRLLVDRVGTIPGVAALVFRNSDPDAYLALGRPCTGFTRALVDVACERRPVPRLLDLRTVAAGLSAQAASGGRHRTTGPRVCLVESGPPVALLRTAGVDEAPSYEDIRHYGHLCAAAELAERDYHRPMLAADCHRRLILQSQRLYGLNHPNTMRHRQLLARFAGMAGAAAEAVAVLDELHSVQEATHDPRTAKTAQDLAYWSSKV